ncbi:hypothetical protein [Microvirga sp. TS319]|uniref:hypothetical protein n=1 Tax=Microvirga sp. TS319 TaxID=3241165 RepID=UPI00351A8163
MNRFLVALGAIVAGALLVPGEAAAQRGGGSHGGGGFGGGGGGGRIGGGGFGGGGGGGRIGGVFGGGFGASRVGGFGDSSFFFPQGGGRSFGGNSLRTGSIGYGPRVGVEGGGVIRQGFVPGTFRSQAGFAPGAIEGPRGNFRPGIGTYPGRPGYYPRYGWNYPRYGWRYRNGYGYYGWGYPYYGLAVGALGYPYDADYDYYDYNDNPYYNVTYGNDCRWVLRRVVGPNGGIVTGRVWACDVY